MACACCGTGRCCKGATCTEGATNSKCAYDEGDFTAGGTCSPVICVSPSGAFPCANVTPCKCDYDGGVVLPSCDCNDVKRAGYPSGGCSSSDCEACSASTGLCTNTCTGQRYCCYGVCCPIQQYCSGYACTNWCEAGTTFCNANNPSYLQFDCCPASHKCCGPSGCLQKTFDFGVNTAIDDWVYTGVTVSGSITITATGTVQWSGAGSTATPNGVTSAACNCCDGASVSSAFCHMRLIGRIGTSGNYFSVGTHYSGNPGSGLLYLRQNDTAVGDNSGYFTGTITINPCPTYTGASVDEPIVYDAAGEPVKPLFGPGAALKSILRVAGIVSSPTCSCNARAAQMDAWGEWECLKRLPEICGWLKEEADKRSLWFFRPAGAVLILAAISLAALKRPFRGNNR